MTLRAMDHYENFPVASWLCPPDLRAPILAIYRFARTADDLADEGDASAAQRLQDLAAFRADLQRCAQGSPVISRWPEVFDSLGTHIRAHALPLAPLENLLSAFAQDVEFTRDARRYTSRAQLLDYCSRSANPVGRLLLHLYGVHDSRSLALSDDICSALQLINFWQDLSVDVPRGRLYLPTDADLRSEITFARQLMLQGAPLVHRIAGRAGWELRAVVQGGLRMLDKIEAMDTRQQRPTLRAWDLPILAWRVARMRG